MNALLLCGLAVSWLLQTEGDSLSYDFLCGPRTDVRGPPAAGCLSQVAQVSRQGTPFVALRFDKKQHEFDRLLVK